MYQVAQGKKYVWGGTKPPFCDTQRIALLLQGIRAMQFAALCLQHLIDSKHYEFIYFHALYLQKHTSSSRHSWACLIALLFPSKQSDTRHLCSPVPTLLWSKLICLKTALKQCFLWNSASTTCWLLASLFIFLIPRVRNWWFNENLSLMGCSMLHSSS